MRHTPRLCIVIGLAVCALAGCGDDESEFDPDPVAPVDAYRATVGAQCLDAKQTQQALPVPEVGSETQLAAYLEDTAAIAADLSDRLERLDPPSELQRGMGEAIDEETQLGEIVAGYARAARGGREFELVLTQLETEANAQIRKLNRAFGELDIPGCQGEELDLPVGP